MNTTTEKRLHPRLSPNQQQLLNEIEEVSEGSTTTWVECQSEEWRSAQALQRKGLIEIVSDRSGVMGTFEVKLTKI